MEKNNIIKICLIIITIYVIAISLLSVYYNMKYTIRNHEQRKSICDNKGLAYFRATQVSKEFIECCKIEDRKLIYCEEFLA